MTSDCPFCKIAKHDFSDVDTSPQDIVYENNDVMAFVSTNSWNEKNTPIIIIPKIHSENVYDCSPGLVSKISLLSQKIAIAIKQLIGSDGVSMRQHNELAGNQSVFHYHVQVIPRYNDDNFYVNYNERRKTTEEELSHMARTLKGANYDN